MRAEIVYPKSSLASSLNGSYCNEGGKGGGGEHFWGIILVTPPGLVFDTESECLSDI